MLTLIFFVTILHLAAVETIILIETSSKIESQAVFLESLLSWLVPFLTGR